MPYTKKQKQYINSCWDKTYNIKTGATRSGKTYLDISYAFMERVVSLLGKPGLCLLMGVTKNTIESNVLSPMRDIFGKKLVGEIRSDNKVRLFGQWFIVVGCSNKKAVSIIRGKSVKYAYCDEIADWSKEVWDIIPSRLDKEYSRLDGTLNPQGKNHWFKKWLDEHKEDVYLQEYKLDDNEFLPVEVKERIKRDYAGTIFYDRYVLGKWTDAEGAIYRIFSEDKEKYFISKDEAKKKMSGARINVGLDFGGTGSKNALSCSAITQRGELISLKSLTFESSQKNIYDMIPIIKSFVNSIKKDYGHVDMLYADNAEPTIINTLIHDIRDLPIKGCTKDNINNRIKTTLLLMNKEKYFMIEEENKDLIEALEDAVYMQNVDEDIRLDNGTSNIDQLDAFEYTFSKYLKFLQG